MSAPTVVPHAPADVAGQLRSLRENAQLSAARSATAIVRHHLVEIESLFAEGYRRAHILEALRQAGLKLSAQGFDTALKRARKVNKVNAKPALSVTPRRIPDATGAPPSRTARATPEAIAERYNKPFDLQFPSSTGDNKGER